MILVTHRRLGLHPETDNVVYSLYAGAFLASAVGVASGVARSRLYLGGGATSATMTPATQHHAVINTGIM